MLYPGLVSVFAILGVYEYSTLDKMMVKGKSKIYLGLKISTSYTSV